MRVTVEKHENKGTAVSLQLWRMRKRDENNGLVNGAKSGQSTGGTTSPF